MLKLGDKYMGFHYTFPYSLSLGMFDNVFNEKEKVKYKKKCESTRIIEWGMYIHIHVYTYIPMCMCSFRHPVLSCVTGSNMAMTQEKLLKQKNIMANEAHLLQTEKVRATLLHVRVLGCFVSVKHCKCVYAN